MYDPTTARFLSEDTVDGDPNDPLSLNKYTYSFNNPLKYYDSTRHWPDWVDDIGSAISSGWDSISSAVSSAWDNTTSFVSSAWNDTTSAVSSAWNDTTSAVSSAWNDTTSAVNTAWSSTVDTVNSDWNSTVNTWSSSWDSPSSWGSVVSFIGNTWDSSISSIGSAWSSSISDIGNTWGSSISDIGNTWGSSISNIGSTWNTAASDIGNSLNTTMSYSMSKIGGGINKSITGIGTAFIGSTAIDTGVDMTIGGIAAIAAAPEIAIPLIVIGSAATIGGGIALGTGLSDTFEGINNIYNGFAGINTPAYNPVRDTIFGGDEASYRTTQMVGLTLATAGFAAAPIAIPLVSNLGQQGVEANTGKAISAQDATGMGENGIDELAKTPVQQNYLSIMQQSGIGDDSMAGVEGMGNPDELVKVYRGTSSTAEKMIHEETGQLMSDATRRAYMETGNIEEAYKASESTHNEWLKIWGNENNYVQAHGEFGTELPQAFGLDRTMMSVTTDPAVAQRFAGQYGKVYEALIPKSQLIPQTLSGAGESEYLIKFGSGGFK